MRRTRRLTWQVLLLPLLAVLATADTQLFTVLVAAVALGSWALSVAVAGMLVWLARMAEHDAKATGEAVPVTLLEAADNATTMVLVETGVTLAAGIATARVLGLVPTVGTITLALLGWALVLVGVPAVGWITTLRRVWLPMVARLRR